jgi:hypothetical protein
MAARRYRQSSDPKDLARMRGLVEKVLVSIGQGGRLAELAVFQSWARAVGPLIASRAMPLQLHEGTLTVGVSGSAWMNQLHIFRDDIAAKLNGCLGRQEVTAVKLVLHRQPPRAGRPQRREPARQATEADRRFVEETIATLADDQIREALRRIFTRQVESGESG